MSDEIEFTSELIARQVRRLAEDKFVIQAARVSVIGENEELSEDEQTELERLLESGNIQGLIWFLMRNRHGTPFEHNYFQFFIDVPIKVWREFHRHRIAFSFNEESGRYKQLRPKFYVAPRERPLGQVGKPGAYEMVPVDAVAYTDYKTSVMAVSITAYEEYEHLLKIGIAREAARDVLPVNIYSSCYVSCNARSLMNFLSLRRLLSEEEAMFPSKPMWEIDQVARKLEAVFKEAMPVTHTAFVKARYVAP